MREPALDTVAVAEIIVADSDLACSMAPPHQRTEFPAVLATARMVALMELASARVLLPFVRPGEQSVGVTIEVEHTAPTPAGAAVRATARFVGRDGKLFLFEIRAEDGGGQIGRGTHKRAIVSVDRLENRAASRNGASHGNSQPGE
ncbi:MAG: thioesterase [Planctomycetota bacterium]|nr:MAG: thioesterase [Planctomycetota bacterium]